MDEKRRCINRPIYSSAEHGSGVEGRRGRKMLDGYAVATAVSVLVLCQRARIKRPARVVRLVLSEDDSVNGSTYKLLQAIVVPIVNSYVLRYAAAANLNLLAAFGTYNATNTE